MLVKNGVKYEVPGVSSKCYLDDPKYTFGDKTDYKFRTKPPTMICVHTRLGIFPQKIVPASGAPTNRRWDEVAAARMTGDDRYASWHISIDADGSFVCHLDLETIWAYHASQINEYSIGIEMYQETDGTIYQPTLDTCVKVIDVLTRIMGIQRQIPKEDKISVRFATSKKTGNRKKDLGYLPGGRSGTDYVGIVGHRNVTRNRGKGDPGYVIFQMLKDAGYEEFSVDVDEDKKVWMQRQTDLGTVVDGVPLSKTVQALISKGHPHGMWVKRPGD